MSAFWTARRGRHPRWDSDRLGLARTGRSSRRCTAFYWVVANLSDDGPLLVVVDDAHWGDVASLRFLAFLAPRLAELPVLLLLCARAEEWAQEMLFAGSSSDAATSPLLPAPLSEQACAALVRARFDLPVDDAFCGACFVSTDGNPFLLRALLDELIREHVTPTAASREAVLAMGPRVVTRSIVARLKRLSEVAHPVAAALAVLGDGASVKEVSTVTGLSAVEVRRAAGELARVSILAEEEGLRFAHPIVRNAVYRDLAREERLRMHKSAGDVLEAAGAPPERVAAQLLAVDPAGDERVCEMLRRAARGALETGASHSAVAYLRRALAEPCRSDQRAGLLVELGFAERLVDGAAAIEHLGEALELITDSGPYSEIAVQLAWLLIFAGRAGDAVETAEEALARLGDRDRELRRRLEAMILLAGYHNLSMGSRCARVVAQLGEVEREHSLGARQVRALLLSEAYRGEGSAAEFAIRAERLLSDEVALREDNGGPAFQQPVLVLIEADSEQATAWLDRGLELAAERGDGFARIANLVFRCHARLLRGQLADAILDGREALEAAERWGSQPGHLFGRGFVAAPEIEAGRLDDAERTLAPVVASEHRTAASAGWQASMTSWARLLLARGDPRASLNVILEAASKFEPRSAHWLGWRSHAALCLTLLGEQPERAVSLADEEVAMAREWGAPGALGAAVRTRGLVLGDPQGEDSLREAVAVLEGSICELEHAKALVELGAMLRRTARRREAREPLRSGLELARICGAVPLIERAEEELRATGASPRDVIRTGVDELTASERRVARMAAEGMNNKQIAQALFITVKTVETHLHRSYQKLGISSRNELAHVLEPAPRDPVVLSGAGRSGPNVGGLMDANAAGSAQTAAS